MSKTNRREFLRNASLLTAGGMLAGAGLNAFASEASLPQARGRKSYGLQTYSLSNEFYQGSIADNMKRIYDMGYSYLELAGYNGERGQIGQLPMADVKKAASDAGLEIRCSHLSPSVRGAYSTENRGQIAEFWKKAVDDHAKIDVKMLVQPSQPSTRNIPEVKYVCEVFNEAGKICKDAGSSWGYHNHNMEFSWISPDSEASVFGRRPGGFGGGARPAATPGGAQGAAGAQGQRSAGQGGQGGGAQQQQQSPYVLIQDEFFTNTDPSLVFFELDVYWTVMGMQDPVEYMQKYANRIKALHIKDKYVLGKSGIMNFEQIFRQAYANNITSFFVELERMAAGTGTQFDGVKGCADYLNAASFVR